MNPLAYLIGIPLGLWASDNLHKVPKIIAREKERHAETMETRFGADQQQVVARRAYETIRRIKGRKARAGFQSQRREK